MDMPIHDLRSALAFLESQGESPERVSDALDQRFEVARDYVARTAGVPASNISREENMVIYDRVNGHSMPVLMGLFGSRKRNQLMLTGTATNHHMAFMQALGRRVKPQMEESPVCQQVVLQGDIDLMAQLPILELTERCAGPYITLGLVLARDPETGEYNASVHRFCIHSANTMTVSIFPGHHLGAMYEAAMKKGQSLPISINLGLDPAIYYASCITEPLCNKGDNELEIAGGLRNNPVKISNCLTVDAQCISEAEIIIEAELTGEMVAENKGDAARGSMPEFLGYQGAIPPGLTCPLARVTAITHRENPIYQSLIGPGLEQSELQSITPELATRGFLKQHFPIDVTDVVYNTAGGGLLMAVMQVHKHDPQDDETVVKAAMQVLKLVPPLKHLFVVDEDVNVSSGEDLLWALTTRYQADLDMHTLTADKSFPMDPSQSVDYRHAAENPGQSVKALFDCTVPWAMKNRFKRPFC